MLDFHQSALSASWLGTRQRGKLSFANVCGHIRLGGCGVDGAAMPAIASTSLHRTQQKEQQPTSS